MIPYVHNSDDLDLILGKVYKLEYIKSIYRTKIQKFKRNDYIIVPDIYQKFFKHFNSYDQLKEKFFSIYKNVDIYTINKADNIGNIIEFTVSDISEESDFYIVKSSPILISGVILTGMETSSPDELSTKSIIGVTSKEISDINYLYPIHLDMTLSLSGYNSLYNLSSSKDEVKL